MESKFSRVPSLSLSPRAPKYTDITLLVGTEVDIIHKHNKTSQKAPTSRHKKSNLSKNLSNNSLFDSPKSENGRCPKSSFVRSFKSLSFKFSSSQQLKPLIEEDVDTKLPGDFKKDRVDCVGTGLSTIRQNDLLSDLPTHSKHKHTPGLDILSHCPDETPLEDLDGFDNDIQFCLQQAQNDSVRDSGTNLSVVQKPPLLRSRTLPAIVVPAHLTTDITHHLERKDGRNSLQRPVHLDCRIRPLVTVTAHDDEGNLGEVTILVEGGDIYPPPPPLPISSTTHKLSVPHPPSTGLGRLARLLTKDSRDGGENYRRRTHSLERTPATPGSGSSSRRSSVKDLLVSLSERRRSLRLHDLPSHHDIYRRDSTLGTESPIPRRSASMDSLVDQVNNNSTNTANQNSLLVPGGYHQTPPTPSALIPPTSMFASFKGNGAPKAQMPGSPSTGRKFMKPDKPGMYFLPNHNCDGWSTMEGLISDGFNLAKTDRKISKINIHQHALFLAVQNGQVEKADKFIRNNTLDINSLNSENLSCLDVAVMNHNLEMVKLLQKHGATEPCNVPYCDRLQQLEKLVKHAETKLEMRRGGGQYKETDRQRELHKRNYNMLNKMKNGLETLQPPGSLSSASVEVIDSTRVRVYFKEPPPSPTGITTKFKIEWSTDDWHTVTNTLELSDLRRTSAVIERLQQGRRHHFRVSAGNMKDYGPTIPTNPQSVVPSSWRDLDARKPRYEGLLKDFGNLFNSVRNSRPEHASEIRAIEPGQETPLNQRRSQKKKATIMQLFTPAPKFHKNLKRGCYLASIMWCENKILVTTEEFLPVIEVDENFPSQPKQDLKWLMEVATTWDDVKNLRQDMERAGSVSYLPFRSKLLQAAANMQTALGVQDLGKLYHDSIRDVHGTIVFCTVQHLKSTKCISAMNVKWVPINKLKERKLSSISPSTTPGEPPSLTASELLLSSVNQQTEYQKNSSVSYSKGLYIGYLKLQSSMEQLKVLVPHSRPNMFPCVKIRDNTHVSKEEWQWIQELGTNGNEVTPSPAQSVWQSQLSTAAQKLVNELGVTGEHRIYSGEVLDLGCDVSLILMFPPTEQLFCNPGQEDALLNKPDLLTLPIHTFEMIHMSTYQSQLLGRYARLNCILEMDKLVAEHAKRESFSEEEIQSTKQRLTQVQSFTEQLEEGWKKLRWVKDAISFARDKSNLGVPLSSITSTAHLNTNISRMTRSRPSSFRFRHSDSSSPPASPPFHHTRHIHHSSSDSVHLGADQKRFCKAEHRSNSSNNLRGVKMRKSSTAENVRVTPKSEINFVKSNTSECLFRPPNSDSSPIICSTRHFTKNSNAGGLNPSYDRFNNRMYNKDKAMTRSDYHIQDSIEPLSPLPRKVSAPPFLDANTSSHFNTTSLGLKNTQQDSTSIESLPESNSGCRRRKDTMYETKESALKISNAMRSTNSSYDLQQQFSHNDIKRAGSSLSHESEASSINASPKSLSSTETETDTLSLMSRESGKSEGSELKLNNDGENIDPHSKKAQESAIIQVSPAYDTGMSNRMTLKLQVSHKTTARDVIDLVVQQLNLKVYMKGKAGPTYNGNEKLQNFCLVSIIDKRERCLRDDLKLLSLQDPWKQGEFYIRFKNDTLAAIDQSAARHLSRKSTASKQSSTYSKASSTSGVYSSSTGSVEEHTLD